MPSVIVHIGVADLLTPVAAFLKLAHGQPNAFLLESIEGGTARGRYSVIGMTPDLIWRCRNGVAEINRHALSAPHAFVAQEAAPLDSLRTLLAESRMDLPAGVPPMAGGVVGYLGYDMVRLMERLPGRTTDPLGLPDSVLLRPTLFAIFDNVRDEFFLVAPVRGDERAQLAAERRIEDARTALARPLPAAAPPVALPPQPQPVSNFTVEQFCAAVVKAKEYIAAGDAFQIVPSQRFSAPFALPPFALYRALRRINPAPFLFFLNFDSFSVVGSSPEILVRLRDNRVTIRPLAGTRKRGETPAEDAALEADLLADPKERAEHLMLVDLGRNDVGRVSVPGSVAVTSSFAVERFSHVMHISSTVEGILRPGLDAVDALAAGFPAGTLTGAPKIRAMEIIDELEPVRRGIYAGCIGYFAPDGTMDTCIGLRMAVLKDGIMHVQAGAGVVADSVPAAEEAETRQKSRALFRAAEEAVRFAAVG
jgi:anthranilate synthase component 1